MSRMTYAHWLFFLQDVFQAHWTFVENLRTTLHSWGFSSSILFVWHFCIGSSKVFGQFCLTGTFRTCCWGLPSKQYYWQSLLSFLGCSFTPLLSGGFLHSLARPKQFPVFSGLLNSQRDWCVPVSDLLGSLLPVFLFHRSVTNNLYWGFFPALQRVYFGGYS